MAFFDPAPAPTGGLHAAATERNRGPILEILRRVLPPTGLVLEIASGTGQHAAFFARELPALRWQPSDPSPVHLESIRARTAASGVTTSRHRCSSTSKSRPGRSPTPTRS